MVDVAIPERFESEFKFGPFTVFRIIRLIPYLVVVGILTFMVSGFFAVLFLLVLFAVLYRREGIDLDVYLMKYISFRWKKRKYLKEDTKDILDVKSIRSNILETSSSYNVYIEVSGISPVLLSPEAVNMLFDYFVSFVNTIDFDIEIRSYPTMLDVNHIVSTINEDNVKNENMKKLVADYKRMLKSISENVIYNTTIIIIPHEKRYSQGEQENFDDIKRELERKASVIMGGLQSMGFNAYMLTGEDIMKRIRDIYMGVKIIGVPAV